MSVTDFTLKLAELMLAPATTSVKSGPGAAQRRPPERLSSSSTVSNDDFDHRRSATRFPSVTVAPSTRP